MMISDLSAQFGRFSSYRIKMNKKTKQKYLTFDRFDLENRFIAGSIIMKSSINRISHLFAIESKKKM